MRTDRPAGRPQGTPERSSPSSSTSLLSSHATHSHAASLHFSSSSWTFSSICPISVAAAQVGESDGAAGAQPSLSRGDGGRGHSLDKDGDKSRRPFAEVRSKTATVSTEPERLCTMEAREQRGLFPSRHQDAGRTCKNLPSLKRESNSQPSFYSNPSLFPLGVAPLHCHSLHL